MNKNTAAPAARPTNRRLAKGATCLGRGRRPATSPDRCAPPGELDRESVSNDPEATVVLLEEIFVDRAASSAERAAARAAAPGMIGGAIDAGTVEGEPGAGEAATG